MKILAILSANPFYVSSASANRWLTLLEGLSRLGVRIDVIITGGFNSREEFKERGFSGCQGNMKYRYLVPFVNSNIWIRRLNLYLITSLLQPLIVFRIVHLAIRGDYSIIWPSFDLIGLRVVANIKKRNKRIKAFMELSEYLDIHQYNRVNKLSRWREDKIMTVFEENIFYKLDALALMTKSLYRHFDSYPKSGPKLLHLPMTVDLARFRQKREAPSEFRKPYIVFIGAMSDTKEGVSTLIKAFYKIKDFMPGLKVYLVGPWNYDTPEHLKLIKELEIEGKVIWMGEYKRDEIPAILKNATLLALPRPESKQAQGGFPTKLGEYLATGNPVCATTVGELSDYLEDGESVFFADPNSVESFANTMKKALGNSEESKRIGANGRKVAETQFNKEIQAKVLYMFLVRLIKE